MFHHASFIRQGGWDAVCHVAFICYIRLLLARNSRMSVLVWCMQLFLLVLVMLLPQADIFSGTFFLTTHNFLSFKEVVLSGSQMGSRYRPFGRPAGSSGGGIEKISIWWYSIRVTTSVLKRAREKTYHARFTRVSLSPLSHRGGHKDYFKVRGILYCEWAHFIVLCFFFPVKC